MKRSILFPILIFFAGYMSAQEIVFEQTFETENSNNDIKSFTHTIQPSTDGSYYSHLLFTTKSKIKHQYKTIDGRYREINAHFLDDENTNTNNDDAKTKRRILNLYKKSDYKLHIVSHDKVIDVLFYPITHAYYFVATSPKTGEISIEDTVFVKYNADFIDCYYEDSTIFLINYFPEESEIKISQKKLNDKVKNKKIVFKTPVKRNELVGKKILSETNKKAIFHIPERNLWLPPIILDYNVYSFRNKNELQVVFNDKEHNTWIETFNIISGEVNTKKYPCPSEIKGDDYSTITAWIADSTLIRGYADTDKIFLFCNNIEDTSRYNTFTITESNISSIASTPINKTGNFWSKSNYTVSDLSFFLKKANNHKLLITGYENNGRLFLTLATKFDIPLTATFLGNIFTLGALDFRQVKPPSYLSFDISLQPESKKTNVGPTKQLVWDKILMSVYANRNNMLATISYENDNYYLAFVNIGSRKLTVYRYHKYL